MFHTPNTHLVELQARAAGLQLVTAKTAGREEDELWDLERAIRMAVDVHGIEGVVSGAILSVYQASRVQRICRVLDLWCFNPLWHTDQEAYMEQLITRGFHVVVSGVFAEPFGEEWLGREIDRQALSDLKAYARRYRISLTGEGGEYESLVLDAPFFSARIEIGEASAEYRNYRGVLRVRKAGLVEK
jgi:ABC transporter with metal-binding/Fe-S-binding domain ATP-binding protein